MEIIIKGTPKEIADLANELQGQLLKNECCTDFIYSAVTRKLTNALKMSSNFHY